LGYATTRLIRATPHATINLILRPTRQLFDGSLFKGEEAWRLFDGKLSRWHMRR
jgi:hypothetical protein